MDGSQFDDLIRSLTRSRRAMLVGGFALATRWLGVSDTDAKKKRKKKGKNKKAKKPRPNAYGCFNVGQPCSGDSARCCSGICEGSAPKKGKKDSSRCVAHDTSICQVDSDVCTTGVIVACDAFNANCRCTQTTGGASFCGVLSVVVGEGGTCRGCNQDTDCQEEFGRGAACVVLGGICDVFCPDTGAVCLPACPDAAEE